ncbi:hypothetical protein ANN_11111 [Periplaneta americana]|uniref:Uncharacterized protein n=1 Tax=Periplaneta americana TaxID=6978 RepID=A0ABQ8T5R5_PERAM|nr:hypothetical protein ANN_11111 [Periplaneta americana]
MRYPGPLTFPLCVSPRKETVQEVRHGQMSQLVPSATGWMEASLHSHRHNNTDEDLNSASENARRARHYRHNRKEKITVVYQKNARTTITKNNYGMDPTRNKEKRTTKEDLDGGRTSSYGCSRIGAMPMDEQRGLAFGFRKTATAVMTPE